MRKAALPAAWLLLFGRACGPAPPPPAEAPSASPEAAVGLSAQRDPSTRLPARPEAVAADSTAGADPLEEESTGPTAIGGSADGSAPDGAPAASTLPSWLRAVRE